MFYLTTLQHASNASTTLNHGINSNVYILLGQILKIYSDTLFREAKTDDVINMAVTRTKNRRRECIFNYIKANIILLQFRS